MNERGVFRVNYYENNTPVSKLIVALTDVEAVTFVGALNVSGVSSVRLLFPVEVAGLDKEHAALPAQPINVAPFDMPKSVSRDEFNSVVAQLAEVQAKLGGHGTALPDQPAVVKGTNP